MDSPPRKPLAEDASGVRPGHPKTEWDRMECAEAARETWLHTTSQTVRALIERGDLDGYWKRAPGGRKYNFWTYRQAVEQFITSFGRFPEARRHLADRRRTLSGTKQRGQRQRDATEASRLQLRILGLQETVRCQSAVIEKLRLAMTAQETVAAHLRQAESAGARAAKLLGEANEEYHRLVSLEGIPDNPSAATSPPRDRS